MDDELDILTADHSSRECIVDATRRKFQTLFSIDLPLKKIRKFDNQFESYSGKVSDLPTWVNSLCEAVETRQNCIGIFRKNASDAKLHNLKDRLLSHGELNASMTGVEAGALLKNLLREMKPKVFNQWSCRIIIAIFDKFPENHHMIETLLLDMVLLLPIPYIGLCKRIFHSWNFIARCSEENKMTVENIATCVSMSLFDFDFELSADLSAKAIKAFNRACVTLIRLCYKIGLPSTEILHLSLSNKLRQESPTKRKWIGTPMTDLIKRKAISTKRKTLSSNKRCQSCPRKDISRPVSTPNSKLPGRALNFNLATPNNRLSSAHRRLADSPNRLSPSYTTSALHHLQQNRGPALQNTASESSTGSGFQTPKLNTSDRRASFTSSEKKEMPRSVSSVRKRRAPHDDSICATFTDQFDTTYNASKLNFVTFDSTPDLCPLTSPSDDWLGSQDRSGDPGLEDVSNTPLLVNAASAAKACRYRLDSSSHSSQLMLSKRPFSAPEVILSSCDEQSGSDVQQSGSPGITDNASCHNTTFLDPADMNDSEPLSSSSSRTDEPNEVIQFPQPIRKPAHRPLIDIINQSSSTPKRSCSNTETPKFKSQLQKITEEETSLNVMDYSPIGFSVDDVGSDCQDQNQLSQGSEGFTNQLPESPRDLDGLLELDDKRVSFCLSSSSYQTRYQQMKQLWEKAGGSDPDTI